MEIDAVIDTSLFIRALHQSKSAGWLREFIRQKYTYRTPGISVVTQHEYEVGELRAGRETDFIVSFPDYFVVMLDEAIWKRAKWVQDFSIGKNAKMELADLLIASTALSRRIPLLTLNTAHFSHLQDLPFLLRLPKVSEPF